MSDSPLRPDRDCRKEDEPDARSPRTGETRDAHQHSIASGCRARRMIGGFFQSLQSPVVAPEKQSNSVPGRRRFLLGAAAGATALVLDHPALAQVIPASGHATYQLVRPGDGIGHETISFNQSGGMLTVTIEAHIRVTLAMVTIYALDHHETETWQNGTFLSF